MPARAEPCERYPTPGRVASQDDPVELPGLPSPSRTLLQDRDPRRLTSDRPSASMPALPRPGAVVVIVTLAPVDYGPGAPRRPAERAEPARERAGLTTRGNRDGKPLPKLTNSTRNVAFATVASADVFSKPGKAGRRALVLLERHGLPVRRVRHADPVDRRPGRAARHRLRPEPDEIDRLQPRRRGRDAVAARDVRARVERDVTDSGLVRSRSCRCRGPR
jgi:hypothetical protein